MTIYECKHGSLPEDIIYDSFEDEYVIIGDSKEEIEFEFPSFIFGNRKYVNRRMMTNKGLSWGGSHPLYWRPMTDNEKMIYKKNK